ncbi:hypothetical protein B0H13DRAFT_2230463 [Mycena leptocephala]|nr:hypothetical protein B0H13DRAFT_2230463 [Mycena leptocephala]
MDERRGGHREEIYFEKLKELDKYCAIFLVNVDNVGSNQMHHGVVLMGKNTMILHVLRSILPEYPQFEHLLPHVKGNIGFVFTAGDLKEVREIITTNKVAAPGCAGAFAPKDITVPAGNTGMEPGKTSFSQALQIPTKIARGTIQIVADIKVVVIGTPVGQSEATLLNMLNISLFTYSMSDVQIFDKGNVFSPSVLDVDESELIDRFMSSIKTIATLSLTQSLKRLTVAHSTKNPFTLDALTALPPLTEVYERVLCTPAACMRLV